MKLDKSTVRVKWFPRCVLTVVALMIPLFAGSEQSEPPYIDRAVITHSNGVTTLVASDPRPLYQAVSALSEEYGWLIDYEDPVYILGTETKDGTAPAWRAVHPNEKGLIAINGGKFSAQYSENSGSDSAIEQRNIIGDVVREYNLSGNPGHFSLMEETTGHLSVVGLPNNRTARTDQQGTPFLDTRISIPTSRRAVGETVRVILQAVTDATGITAIVGSEPSALLRGEIIIGGSNVVARDLIRQALDLSGRSLRWVMLYEPTYGKYHFNVSPVVRADATSDPGVRHVVPVDPMPKSTERNN